LPFSPPSDFKFSTPEIEHVLVVGVLEVVPMQHVPYCIVGNKLTHLEDLPVVAACA
jgi:hypothetical protein